MKTCFNTKGDGCARTLRLGAFHRKPNAKDGRTSLCRDCYNAKAREWRAHNPDNVAAWNRRDRRTHHEARRETARAYRENNRERLNANERERQKQPDVAERRRIAQRERRRRERDKRARRDHSVSDELGAGSCLGERPPPFGRPSLF